MRGNSLLKLQSKYFTKPLYILIGILIGVLLFIECNKQLSLQYMKDKFEYLQKDEIANYETECKGLKLDYSIYTYSKDNIQYIDIYLENDKLSKVIGVENDGRQN